MTGTADNVGENIFIYPGDHGRFNTKGTLHTWGQNKRKKCVHYILLYHLFVKYFYQIQNEMKH